jgi:uncharacterized protein (DUF305 family)
MALGVWAFSSALLLAGAATALGQSAPIVQPGAPGMSGKVLSPATAAAKPRTPAAADIEFMQGMIHHHSQAVDMTDLMPARTHNKKLLALGKRISISQTDEIRFMRQWLAERNQAAPMNHKGHDMKAMPGMMDMASMPLMPGMLSAEQMKALAKASGPAFDRLFLTGMIQHHTGALIMVEDLFDTAGAGQDNVLFDFATDIDNTQRAEIQIMQGMLKEKP